MFSHVEVQCFVDPTVGPNLLPMWTWLLPVVCAAQSRKQPVTQAEHAPEPETSCMTRLQEIKVFQLTSVTAAPSLPYIHTQRGLLMEKNPISRLRSFAAGLVAVDTPP